MPEMEHISKVRTAATWMRQTGKPIDQYPKRDALDPAARREAEHFACGILPWPSRWTKRIYELATAG